MKWFILIVVSASGDVDMQDFYGETACVRAMHFISEAHIQPDVLVCTPRRIK